MADETSIAIGVMQIAVMNGGKCTFRRAYREIPNLVNLTAANKKPSVTRPGELMWQQLVRNIKSHHEAAGNFIAEGLLTHIKGVGYAITPAGVSFLKRKGLHP